MDKNKLIGKKWPVLDKGHIILLDYMGSDQDIVDAARTSYQKGTKKVSDDRNLIRYLMRHRHTTPFEMAEVKFHIRMPMDSWRQMIRHRVANVNEYSTRYSEAIDDKQTTEPDQWRLQSSTNKQGSGGYLTDWSNVQFIEDEEGNEHFKSMVSPGSCLSNDEKNFHEECDRIYKKRLRWGVAREQARKDLPLSTYTEAVWKCDLHNIFHYLSLRMDGHAQLEIRSYANIIGNEIIAKLFPLSLESFVDYRMEAMTFSKQEIELLGYLLDAVELKEVNNVMQGDALSKREQDEFRTKLSKITGKQF